MSAGTTQIRGWFNENSGLVYPFVHSYDVPRSILADISVSTNTDGLHVSVLAVDGDYVSLILSDNTGIFAALSGRLIPGKLYPLESDRGAGLVAFGNFSDVQSYRSTTPLYLQNRCVQKSYATLPVVRRQGLAPSDAPLRLIGGEDINIRYGFIDDAETLPALFIGLDTSTSNRSEVHERYLGPCDLRPELNNCGDPQPVRSIGGVPADCCNTIYIELQGVSVTPLTNYCGVAIGIDYGLADACPPRELSKLVNISKEECPTPEDYAGYAAQKVEDDSNADAVESGDLISGDGTLVPPASVLDASDNGGFSDRPEVDVYGNSKEYDVNKITTSWTYRFGKTEGKVKPDDAEGDIPTSIVTD